MLNQSPEKMNIKSWGGGVQSLKRRRTGTPPWCDIPVLFKINIENLISFSVAQSVNSICYLSLGCAPWTHFPFLTLWMKLINAYEGISQIFKPVIWFRYINVHVNIARCSIPLKEQKTSNTATKLQLSLLFFFFFFSLRTNYHQLTCTPGKRVLILCRCLAMSTKSMNLNRTWVTAPAAWTPQFRSSASRDWGPYMVRLSPSRSARLLRSLAYWPWFL